MERSEMVRKMLSAIGRLNSVDALAEELNMRKPTVRAILDFMIHAGYIDEITCRNICSVCPMNCDTQVPRGVKMYVVTDKGVSVLNEGISAKEK